MTDYLFVRPSFIGGVASCLDLFGVRCKYNTSKTPEEADRKAFIADCLALKKDGMIAFNEVVKNVRA